MINSIFIFLLLFFYVRHPLNSQECYSEYWQQFFLKMWENDFFALATYVKVETGNNFQNIRSTQLSEQLIWKASERMTMELHYTYVHGRSVVSDSSWRWQHRLELEANPLFKLSNKWLIKTRNRLEIRRVEKEPDIVYRIRQKTTLVVPFDSPGLLQSFSIFNELFYNISTHLFTEDRLCPFLFTISTSDHIKIDLFFLIRFFEHEKTWKKSAVFGTQFSF